MSPEFVVASLAILALQVEPVWLSQVSKVFASAPDGVKYIALVPVGIALWCVQQSRIILFPQEDTKGLLQEWPKFIELKTRVLIGLIYQGVFSILGITAWFIAPKLDSGTSTVVMGMAVVGSLTGAVTFYLASLMATEITKRHATKI